MSARTLRRYRAFLLRKVHETVTGTLPPGLCICPAFCFFCLGRLRHDWALQHGSEPMGEAARAEIPYMYRRLLG